MKKLFHKLHLWLSLPFGIIITITCLTGAILVFEDEAMHTFYPERYYVESAGRTPLPVDSLLRMVTAQLPDTVSATAVVIPSAPGDLYQVMLSKPRRASVSVDPYSGSIASYNQRTPFFLFVFRMHRWLLDSVKPDGSLSIGKTVVGISTLMMVFILLSGLVIWIPKSIRMLKNRLSFKTSRGSYRFWYDLHVSGGFYALVFLLVMSLTGLTWSFTWYRTGFYNLFGAQVSVAAPAHAGGAGTSDRKSRPQGEENGNGRRGQNNRSDGKEAPVVTPFMHWETVYQSLKEQHPQFKKIQVGNGTATVAFERYGNQRAADQFGFDPRTGQISTVTRYEDQDASSRLRGLIYSIHVGNWGGLLTKILYCLAALIGATLPLTGYYFWIKKRAAKRRSSKK